MHGIISISNKIEYSDGFYDDLQPSVALFKNTLLSGHSVNYRLDHAARVFCIKLRELMGFV